MEGMSQRGAARYFGIDPRTVAKMMRYSVPPDPAQPDRAAETGVDRANVVEQVLVKDPNWRIRVRGHAVPMPSQPFSLIVTTAR